MPQIISMLINQSGAYIIVTIKFLKLDFGRLPDIPVEI